MSDVEVAVDLQQIDITIEMTGIPGAAGAASASAVTSVFGRTGAVVAASGDYAAADLSNGTTGSGAVVLTNTPTIVTPTIASFTNAGHSHSNAAGGGKINPTTALNSAVPVTLGGTALTSATAYGIIAAGTTSTGTFQVISPGSSGQFLKSAGASALASFASLALSDIASGFAAGVATFLATPTSANLATAVTDESGSGGLVFATYVDAKVSDTAYATSWDAVTTIAPSKNAVYDKVSLLDSSINIFNQLNFS